MDEQVMRLMTFRPVRVAYDEILRSRVVPGLAGMPGVIDCYSGRQGPDDLGPRIVASVWQSEAAIADADLDRTGNIEPREPDEVTDRIVEILPLLVVERFTTAREPRVLRLVRGRVRAGEFSAYAEDVRAGAEVDALGEGGPLSLYMGGHDASDEFVTLSTWHSWEDIEAASGGDVHQPRATRRPERLVEWDVSHYEIVPNC